MPKVRKKQVARRGGMTPGEYLSPFPPAIRAAANEVRSLVAECLPGVIERVYTGWKLIGYRIPDGAQSRYCCYLYATHERAELGFEQGRLLSDPRGVLEGEGTQVRKVIFRTPADIRKPIVRQLLLEAAIIAKERSTWPKR
jgi:hypothetical protein